MKTLIKKGYTKTLLIIMLIILIGFSLNAQPEQLNKDKVAFNIETSVFNNDLIGTNPFFFKSSEETKWNAGIDVSYFDKKRLAVICGLSYGKINEAGILTLKLGGKYYLLNYIPLGFDFIGYLGREYYGDFLPLYMGLQSGLALFIGNNISIEPTLKYNISLSNYYRNYLQGLIVFSIYI